jgi:hypothetical protein
MPCQLRDGVLAGFGGTAPTRGPRLPATHAPGRTSGKDLVPNVIRALRDSVDVMTHNKRGFTHTQENSMKRLVVAGAATAAVTLGFAASTSQAQTEDPTIMLLHGIPGATVDVLVDGDVVIDAFEPGKMQDLSAFAGQTLTNLEVRLDGADTVVIGPVAEFAVPASGNLTVVAHLDADGNPALSPFANDVATIAAGQGRLTVRHAAAAPAVDIVLGDARPFTNLVNGDEGKADLPAGPISGAKIAPTGGDPIADVPNVTLAAGSNLIVYAVGSLEEETFTFYTQEITGLGGAPTAVNSGEPVSSSTTGLLVGLAGAAVLLAGSGFAVRRARAATVKA